MKTLILSLIAGFLVSASAPVNDTTAYICNGKYSKKYHLKQNCRGLSNCSTEIEKTTVSKAKTKGRTLCGYED